MSFRPIYFSSMCRCLRWMASKCSVPGARTECPLWCSSPRTISSQCARLRLTRWIIWWKPLHVERFEAALQRVRERLRLVEAAGLAARLAALLDAEKAEREKCGVDRLVVPIATGELVIPVADIDWIGADDYYACLHVGAKSHLLRESLTSLETRLDSRRFARVHRSAIVQIDRIRALHGDEVVLRGGMRVAVSRRRRAAIEGLLRSAGARFS